MSKESNLETTTRNAGGYSPIAPFFRVCDGLRIRFADNKADSPTATVLMLSPWPESLWAFRRIWDRVSGAARVVAIDLPGFGHSDGRPELIAPDAMGSFLARLIGAWGLGAPHLVGSRRGHRCCVVLGGQRSRPCHELDDRWRRRASSPRCRRRAQGRHRGANLDVVRELDAPNDIGFAVKTICRCR